MPTLILRTPRTARAHRPVPLPCDPEAEIGRGRAAVVRRDHLRPGQLEAQRLLSPGPGWIWQAYGAVRASGDHIDEGSTERELVRAGTFDDATARYPLVHYYNTEIQHRMAIYRKVREWVERRRMLAEFRRADQKRLGREFPHSGPPIPAADCQADCCGGPAAVPADRMGGRADHQPRQRQPVLRRTRRQEDLLHAFDGGVCCQRPALAGHAQPGRARCCSSTRKAVKAASPCAWRRPCAASWPGGDPVRVHLPGRFPPGRSGGCDAARKRDTEFRRRAGDLRCPGGPDGRR